MARPRVSSASAMHYASIDCTPHRGPGTVTMARCRTRVLDEFYGSSRFSPLDARSRLLSPGLRRIDQGPVDHDGLRDGPSHRPVLEFVDGPVEMPNLVVEVGVAESTNQTHEAIEVCAVRFVRHPRTDRVLVR